MKISKRLEIFKKYKFNIKISHNGVGCAALKKIVYKLKKYVFNKLFFCTNNTSFGVRYFYNSLFVVICSLPSISK